MKELNILYQSSAAYAIPAAVSICSLCENNKNIDQLRIWFIDVGLTDEDRKKIQDLVGRYSRSITFLSSESTDELLREAGVRLWSNSYATFYKIFACCHLEGIDRILYIDADTLVLGSLEALCDMEMDGYACAMVGSGMTGRVKDYLNVKQYYNAGVIYFNLQYWHEHNVEQAFLDVVNSEECVKYTLVGDETLINYTLRGKIKKMPLMYNFESSWGLWGWNHDLYGNLGWKTESECYYTDGEIASAKVNPIIAHYVDLTTGRPWDYLNDNPFRKEFAQYLELLKPWKKIDFAMRGIGGDNKIIAWLKFLVKKIMSPKVRSKIGFMQHDKYWAARIAELR